MCLAQHVQSAINLKSHIWKLLAISYFLWPTKVKKPIWLLWWKRRALLFSSFIKWQPLEAPNVDHDIWSRTKTSRRQKQDRCKIYIFIHTYIYFISHLLPLSLLKVLLGWSYKGKGKEGQETSHGACPMMPRSRGRWGTRKGQKRQSGGNSHPKAEVKHLVLHQGALKAGEDLSESGGQVRATRPEAVSYCSTGGWEVTMLHTEVLKSC